MPQQFNSIDIPKQKVLARLGYLNNKTRLDSNTDALIDTEILVAKKLIVAKQVISTSKIAFQGSNSLLLEPGFTISSNDIFKLVKDCVSAYGFAVTIGPNLESKRDEYSNSKENSRALILDAIGSVAAEELAEITNKEISATAQKDGLKTTRRFSPGYGDWQLQNQKEFLKWLGADKIGIKLTENYQMLPEKSVSAILGVYK